LADRTFPGPDEWRTEPDGTRTCSFCGSLHEDDFIDILEHYVAGDEGYHFDPSTKGYKRYAHRPGVSNAGQGGIKFYGWHVDPKHPDHAKRTDLHAKAVEKFSRDMEALWPHKVKVPA
jgi:hypothetical protein